MSVQKTEIRVRFGDTDMAGVVYVARYIHYFMCGFEDLFRRIGLPIEDMIKTEIEGFPPTEITIRFLAPAYCGDLLEVHTRIGKSFKKGVTLTFELYRKEDETLLATGSITFISINEKRKAITLPQYIMEALHTFEEEN